MRSLGFVPGVVWAGPLASKGAGVFGRRLLLAKKGESFCFSLAFQEYIYMVASGLGRPHGERKTLESIIFGRVQSQKYVQETCQNVFGTCRWVLWSRFSSISIYCGLGDQALTYVAASFYSSSQEKPFWTPHKGQILHSIIQTLPMGCKVPQGQPAQ